MSSKLELFFDAHKVLEEQRRVVRYYEEAMKRIGADERVFIEGMLCGKELRATFGAAVERELIERQYMVARLEESLEERLK